MITTLVTTSNHDTIAINETTNTITVSFPTAEADNSKDYTMSVEDARHFANTLKLVAERIMIEAEDNN